MSSLKELEEMRKEIDASIAEKKEKESQKRREHAIAKIDSFSEEQKQFLLSLIEHDRTSCSDEHVYNGRYSRSDGGWRCRKCMLIEILNGEHGGDFDFDLVPEFYQTYTE